MKFDLQSSRRTESNRSYLSYDANKALAACWVFPVKCVTKEDINKNPRPPSPPKCLLVRGFEPTFRLRARFSNLCQEDEYKPKPIVQHMAWTQLGHDAYCDAGEAAERPRRRSESDWLAVFAVCCYVLWGLFGAHLSLQGSAATFSKILPARTVCFLNLVPAGHHWNSKSRPIIAFGFGALKA